MKKVEQFPSLLRNLQLLPEISCFFFGNHQEIERDFQIMFFLMQYLFATPHSKHLGVLQAILNKFKILVI